MDDFHDFFFKFFSRIFFPKVFFQFFFENFSPKKFFSNIFLPIFYFSPKASDHARHARHARQDRPIDVTSNNIICHQDVCVFLYAVCRSDNRCQNNRNVYSDYFVIWFPNNPSQENTVFHTYGRSV